jgi:hypothetical protein
MGVMIGLGMGEVSGERHPVKTNFSINSSMRNLRERC